VESRCEADGGSHQHHPFGPQVEHPCPLVDEQAHGRQQQRRAGAQRGGDQGGDGFHGFQVMR
jgi:hypothetical protein